jgi:hypothetical protein
MQQIGVIGPLHFLEDCILLADQIYPNRHPTVTLFTIYNTTNKPKTRTHEEPFNIYQIIGPVQRQISVDVPSIAPTAHSSLVRGHRSSLYSFIVGHCIKRYNALFRIGIHLFISL